MTDVWWGLVEKDGPGQYNWTAYLQMVQIAKDIGLNVQAVMSFRILTPSLFNVLNAKINVVRTLEINATFLCLHGLSKLELLIVRKLISNSYLSSRHLLSRSTVQCGSGILIFRH